MTQTQPTPDNVLDRSAVFGSVDVQGAGLVVSRANITCIFGSANVDLRAAELMGAEVGLECFILFGSLELRVPAAWRVIMDVQPFFGNVEERGAPPALEPGAPTLRIRGTVIFGNAELERF